MIHCGAELSAHGSKLYRKLLIASEVIRQQQEMHDADSRRIDDRIINLSKTMYNQSCEARRGQENWVCSQDLNFR